MTTSKIGTGNAKTETIAIPWTHSPVASKLGASHFKQSQPRASHFISWNYATVSYLLLMPVPFLLLFVILVVYSSLFIFFRKDRFKPKHLLHKIFPFIIDV